MRKDQREVMDFDKIVSIIDACQTMRLGLNGGDYPYIVPLTFGYKAENGAITAYFHCATEGRKIDLIKADSRACVELDALHGYVETGHSVTADYESVIAFGKVEKCEGEEKVEGISRLLQHTGYAQYSAEQCAALPIVDVYKIECRSFTGKKRFN